MKKCVNCGKMNLNNATVCKECQCEVFAEFEIKEPKKLENIEDTEHREKLRESKTNNIVVSILFFLVAYFPIYLILTLVDLFVSYEFVASLVIDFVISAIFFSIWYFKSDKEKLIELEFSNDQTAICPHCGSHSITLGSKGYDWNKGFWYRMFNIKGGHYLAGMNSRQVIGNCNDCGHKWKTNKEWIR